MLNKKKNNKGFTLVELLVVIAIIGILAVVAVPALFKNIEKGKVADLESDISALRSAVLSYYTDNSEYPIDPGATSGENDDMTPIFTPDKKTAITGGDTLSPINNKASLAIFSELEGLSFPYGGSYELTNASGAVGERNAVKSPATLYLKITTKDANTTISEAGLDKLAQDLGLTNPATAIEIAEKDKIAVTKTGDKQTIIIPLINK